MRSLNLVAALVTVLVAVVVASCASLAVPAGEHGPTLTIRNEGERTLDLSYRCIDHGPVRRLGAIPPRSSDTFVLEPASCSTIHLVRQPLLGLAQPDAPAFAVVPLFDSGSVELVFGNTGLLMRR
jgi:hypothetical protein